MWTQINTQEASPTYNHSNLDTECARRQVVVASHSFPSSLSLSLHFIGLVVSAGPYPRFEE